MKIIRKIALCVVTVVLCFMAVNATKIEAKAAEKVKIQISYQYVLEDGDNQFVTVYKSVDKGMTWNQFFDAYPELAPANYISDAQSGVEWKTSVQRVSGAISDKLASEIANFNQYTNYAMLEYRGCPNTYKEVGVSFLSEENGENVDSGMGWILFIPTTLEGGSEQSLEYVKKNVAKINFFKNLMDVPGASVTIKATLLSKEDPNRYDDYCLQFVLPAGTTDKIYAGQTADLSESEKLVQDFVSRLYTVAMGREADKEGLTSWSKILVDGEQTGAEVAQGFFFSEEFTNKNLSDSDFIDTLYRTMFNREADSDGKTTWMKALENGMSREFVYRGFATGDEFSNLCKSFGIMQGTVKLTQNRDQNELLTAFVARNYTKALGRAAEEAGINDWTGRILKGEATPADVTAGFIFSAEFVAKDLSNEDFLKVLYQTYFDRDPDADGFNGWMEQLNNGATREYVVNTGFSCSAEFANLVKSFGL